jgi:hypothetical protein
MKCHRMAIALIALGFSMLAAAGAGITAPKAELLVGAWRLRSIEYRDPDGGTADPFYQAGSTGILIYAASGWMSVQISAPGRAVWTVPERRVPARKGPARKGPESGAADADRKAAAFDTYYAYFGRWELDAAASIVTHHVESSVIPGEAGRSYTQSVSFEDGRLVFTNRSGSDGHQTVRRKVWERLPVPP